MAYIYIHTNKINGKKYVGQTTQRPERRWRLHGKGYETSPYFYKAIQKYGWDNFEHEIIWCFEEELDFLEREFIKKYDTMNPEHGYNSESGGNLNKHLSETTKDKLRYKRTDVQRKHMADGSYRKKRCICIELNKEFDSVTNAGKYINIDKNAISYACRNNTKSGGYHWKYIKEVPCFQDSNIQGVLHD